MRATFRLAFCNAKSYSSNTKTLMKSCLSNSASTQILRSCYRHRIVSRLRYPSQISVKCGSTGSLRHYSSYNASSTAAIAGVTKEEIESARAYCSKLVSNYDNPSHTLRAFIPTSIQDAYLALRAFNIDVSRVADATSNAAVGAMRMQFWRDAVTRSLSLTPPKEPVAILLANASLQLSTSTDGRSRFSKVWLHRIVSTREQYLANPPYPDLAALESYAENTYSTLLYLTLSALPLASVTADHVASHIGKAQGIAAVLRGVPLLAFPPPPNHHSNQAGSAALAQGLNLPQSSRRGVITLPLDVMASCNVREEDVLRNGGAATGLRDAVFTVATRANDHLITAREMLKNLRAGRDAGHEFEHSDDPEHHDSPEHRNGSGWGDAPERASSMQDVERAFGIYMQAVAVQSWLDRLQAVDFDIFSPHLRNADWKLPWKAYWAYKRRMI